MDAIGLDFKKQIPHTPGAIERPQLLAKLQDAWIYRLTLISAPPGYGKTTTVSQFASQAQVPVIWHTVQERERDFPNLFNHFLSVFQPLAADIDKDYVARAEISPSDLAAQIGRDLRQAYDGDFIYVLDDIHLLDGMPLCELWLRSLITELPPSCRLIFISRTLPNLAYIDMVAHNELFTMGIQELRLKGDEINRLAEGVAYQSLSDRRKQALTALDGWPAGVFLALQPTSGSLTEAVLGSSREPEVLFEALARPMLTRLPPDLRDFLLKSSTLPYLTPELCENLLSLPNSVKWLNLIQKRNLFLSQVSVGFEYHQLFRGFLQRELRNKYPERYARLHLEAARWFEDRDDFEHAFDHYVAAERLGNAWALANSTAIDYFGQGKFETMLKWAAILNTAGGVAPVLSLHCAMIHSDRYEYADAEAELEKAEQGFLSSSDDVGQAKVKLQRAMIYRMRGDYRAAIELAEDVVKLNIDSLYGRALRIIGSSRLRLGDANIALTHLEKAAQLYRDAGVVTALSHVLQDLQFAYMRLGRLDEMGHCLQEVVALRRKLGGPTALALALNSLGYYYHKRSNYQEALSTFDEGLRLVIGVPERRSEAYLLASLGDLKRDLGLYVEAASCYDKALQLTSEDTDPHLYIAILLGCSTLRRWQGKADEAVMIAEEALSAATDHQMALESTMSHAILWLAKAEFDEPLLALEHLNRIVEELDRQGAQVEVLEILSGCIYVAGLCKDNNAAKEYSAMAVRLSNEIGTAQGLIAEIASRPSLETLFAPQLKSGQLVSDLKSLRKAQSSLQKDISVVETDLPPDTFSLRLLTFGQEQVERDGRVISNSEWQAAASRGLFFYLLFNGPKSRIDCEFTFWPDHGTDQVRAIFNTALYRARQALGPNVIILDENLYFVNPRISVDCDASRLESWTKQARLLSSGDARTEDLWQRAVAVYKGKFLRSLDHQWVVTRREAYRDMYLSALIGLGYCARERIDLDAAIKWFSEAIYLDPFSERAYQQVILCHAQRGEMGKARDRFYELRKTLKDELEIEPSEETISIIRTVLGKI